MSAEPIGRSGGLVWLGMIPDEPRKPNARDRARARTIAKVKEAARFLFVNKGYEATTVRDLGARIGMSTASVYSNFPEGKDQLWSEVMGVPPPTLHLAEEIALLQALRPDWRYVLRFTGSEHIAQIHGPDWKPLQPDSDPMFMGRAASPGEALRQARLAAERHDGRRPQCAVRSEPRLSAKPTTPTSAAQRSGHGQR